MRIGGGTAPSPLATPLVNEEVYEPYRRSQERIGARKRIRSTAERLALEQYRLERLIPTMSADMMRARAAYLGGAAGGEGLERWIAFLKLRPDAPSYLQVWHEADQAQAEVFARDQQSELTRVVTERVGALSAWLETAEAEYQANGRIETPAPELPSDSLYTGLSEDGAPFDLSDEERERGFPAETRERLAALEREVDALEAAAPPEPPMANAVSEGEVVEQRIFVRGNYRIEGEPVAKRFPLVLAGRDQAPVREGSGRRELAEWLVSADNPLTARVIVNRVWQWHFGEGLVRTPSNFGKVGERPTHPELLDYLATRFVAGGWSIKSLHRLIMGSSAYQMSSRASDESWETDPENRLWSRFTRRRLSVEELRDSYLALSGELDRTMGGTLDKGSGGIPEAERNNRRLNPDDYNRRTVYIPLMRNKVPYMLGLFDFGDATTTLGRRTASNVAPQALYLMNGEFAARSAAGFADALSAVDDIVGRAYLGRTDARAERSRARGSGTVHRRGSLPGRRGGKASVRCYWRRTSFTMWTDGQPRNRCRDAPCCAAARSASGRSGCTGCSPRATGCSARRRARWRRASRTSRRAPSASSSCSCTAASRTSIRSTQNPG